MKSIKVCLMLLVFGGFMAGVADAKVYYHTFWELAQNSNVIFVADIVDVTNASAVVSVGNVFFGRGVSNDQKLTVSPITAPSCKGPVIQYTKGQRVLIFGTLKGKNEVKVSCRGQGTVKLSKMLPAQLKNVWNATNEISCLLESKNKQYVKCRMLELCRSDNSYLKRSAMRYFNSGKNVSPELTFNLLDERLARKDVSSQVLEKLSAKTPILTGEDILYYDRDTFTIYLKRKTINRIAKLINKKYQASKADWLNGNEMPVVVKYKDKGLFVAVLQFDRWLIETKSSPMMLPPGGPGFCLRKDDADDFSIVSVRLLSPWVDIKDSRGNKVYIDWLKRKGKFEISNLYQPEITAEQAIAIARENTPQNEKGREYTKRPMLADWKVKQCVYVKDMYCMRTTRSIAYLEPMPKQHCLWAIEFSSPYPRMNSTRWVLVKDKDNLIRINPEYIEAIDIKSKTCKVVYLDSDCKKELELANRHDGGYFAKVESVRYLRYVEFMYYSQNDGENQASWDCLEGAWLYKGRSRANPDREIYSVVPSHSEAPNSSANMYLLKMKGVPLRNITPANDKLAASIDDVKNDDSPVEKFCEIKKGMTPRQVEKILGGPVRPRRNSPPDEFQSDFDYDGLSIIVMFKRDGVSKGPFGVSRVILDYHGRTAAETKAKREKEWAEWVRRHPTGKARDYADNLYETLTGKLYKVEKSTYEYYLHIDGMNTSIALVGEMLKNFKSGAYVSVKGKIETRLVNPTYDGTPQQKTAIWVILMDVKKAKLMDNFVGTVTIK